MKKQEIEHYTNRASGKGTMHIERLLSGEELGNHVAMYAKVTIDVNSSLGFHTHKGDAESYYILQGSALYDDNGITRELGVGDVTFTPDGFGHSIENIGDNELIFMALITKSDPAL